MKKMTEVYCRLTCIHKRTGTTICNKDKIIIGKYGHCLEQEMG